MPTTPDPFDQPQFYDGVPTKRFLAWVVDLVIITCVSLLIVPFTAFTAAFFFPFLLMVVGFIYRVITLANGSATLGMRLFSMELRTAQDQGFDLPTAFFHTLGYTLSVGTFLIQLVSIVMMCSTERGQGLSDMVLGTVALNKRAKP